LVHELYVFLLLTGPEIELVFPPETSFSISDLSAICFHRYDSTLTIVDPRDTILTLYPSFPERQESEPGADAFFHFVIRNGSPDVPLVSPNSPQGSSTFFYGTSCFRQEYDSTTKRRFYQKALVLISNHEFNAFYLKVLSIMAKEGYISDPDRLEAACSEIAAWQAPRIGQQQLPFLGNVLTLDM
jgi:hypothetical protein